MRRILQAIIAVLFVGIAPVVGTRPALASGVTVTGAGSTWVQIAMDQWVADVSKLGLSLNYQSVGSSAGRQFYIINQVDFAASEIPFQPDEIAQLQGEGKSWQYLPDVAGGTSLMYNLHAPDGSQITSLKLSSVAIAGIFTGTITSWQDPLIAADNPGLQIAQTTITPVIRSDGSGTSAQFSLYLAAIQPTIWNAFATQYGVVAPVSYWPNFPGSVAQRGSDGVANYIANQTIGQGSIGYVEYGFAVERGFPVVSVKNASGNYTQPTAANVATALTHATLNADLTQNLGAVYVAPEATAYPISSYSYMITETTGFDPAKGNVLGQFIIYAACGGQQKAALLGYSPLPANLVEDDFAAVERIPGAPTPPALSDCDNPNIQGTGSTGDTGGTGGTGSIGSGSGTTGTTGTTAPSAAPTDVPAGAVSSSFPPGVTPLPSESAQHYREVALRSIAGSRAGSDLPLVLAGFCVVAIVFAPLITRRLGRRTRT